MTNHTMHIGPTGRLLSLGLVLALCSTAAAQPFSFSRVEQNLEPVQAGAVTWGDYDADGDFDLLLTGAATVGIDARIYRNDGGTFTDAGAGLTPVSFAAAAWGDYDNDGDLDLLLAGSTTRAAPFSPRTQLYRNDGGTFVPEDAPFADLHSGAAAWGDYDNDGDLDLLLSGGGSSTFVLDGRTDVYRNDGGTFTRVDLGLKGLLSGTARWGDYNGDHRLDILLLGADQPFGRYSARIYQNHDDTRFEEHALLVGVILGAGSWGDYDGDGDLDLIVIGRTSALVPEDAPDEQNSVPAANLYRNDRSPTDFVPEIPAALDATVDGQTATLSWAPAPGLTYNLQVGTTPGGSDVLAAQADPATGHRYVQAPGNAQGNTTWALHHLNPGTYYWRVQAVNGAYVGSPFAEGGMFEVGATAVGVSDEVPAQVTLAGNYPNPFAGGTTITYTLDQSQPVELRVYNVLGEAVHLLVRGVQGAGVHTAYWDGTLADGTPAGNGLYFYELKAGPEVHTRKMMRIE